MIPFFKPAALLHYISNVFLCQIKSGGNLFFFYSEMLPSVISEILSCDFCKSCKLCELRNFYKQKANLLELSNKLLIPDNPSANFSPLKNIAVNVCLQQNSNRTGQTKKDDERKKKYNENNTHPNVHVRFNRTAMKRLNLLKADRTKTNVIKSDKSPQYKPKTIIIEKGGLIQPNFHISEEKINIIANVQKSIVPTSNLLVKIISGEMRMERSKKFVIDRARVSGQKKFELVSETFPIARNKAIQQLREAVEETRTKLNQKITAKKRTCFGGSKIRRLESTIKKNQNKFLLEKCYDPSSSEIGNKESETLKSENIANIDYLGKAEKVIQEKDLKKNKLKVTKKRNEEPLLIYKGEYIKETQYKNDSKRKKDVATLIAPVELNQVYLGYLKPKSYSMKNVAGKKDPKEISIPRKSHVSKNKVEPEDEKKNLDRSRQNFQKSFFEERIENYKKEYSRISDSIHHNVAMINKFKMKQTKVKICNEDTLDKERLVRNVNIFKSEMNYQDSDNDNSIHGCNSCDKKCDTETLNINIKKSRESITMISNIKTEIKKKKQAIEKMINEYKVTLESNHIFENNKRKVPNCFQCKSPETKSISVEHTPCLKKNFIDRKTSIITESNKSTKPTCTYSHPIKDNIKPLRCNETHGSTEEKQCDHKLRKVSWNRKSKNIEKMEENQKCPAIMNKFEQLSQMELQRTNQQRMIDLKRGKSTPRKQLGSKRIEDKQLLTLKASKSVGELFVKRTRPTEVPYKRAFSNNLYERLLAKKNNLMAQQNDSSSEDDLHRCTEYFIQHVKSSHPDFQRITEKKVLRQVSSLDKSYAIREGSNSTAATYKRTIEARKQGARMMLKSLDRRIQKINSALKEKKNKAKPQIFEERRIQPVIKETISQENVPRKTEFLNEQTVRRIIENKLKNITGKKNTEQISKPKTTRDLNLDQVFANKSNWITLDNEDEKCIRKDIGKILCQV